MPEDNFNKNELPRGGFVNPASMGMPQVSESQLKEISKMLAKQHEGLSPSEIDALVSRELSSK